MINFLGLRNELRMLGAADLLKMASEQKEHHCVLNLNGSCPYYFKYKGNGRVLGVGEPDPFCNGISQPQSLREGNQW
jgi:hypothetical protein